MGDRIMERERGGRKWRTGFLTTDHTDFHGWEKTGEVENRIMDRIFEFRISNFDFNHGSLGFTRIQKDWSGGVIRNWSGGVVE